MASEKENKTPTGNRLVVELGELKPRFKAACDFRCADMSKVITRMIEGYVAQVEREQEAAEEEAREADKAAKKKKK